MTTGTRSGRPRAQHPLTPSASFLNVDLHVRSRRSLAPLVEAWPDVQTPNQIDGRAPRWIVASLTNPRNTDAAIRQWVRLLDSLKGPARRCWAEASSRTFDIGVQAGLGPFAFEEVTLRAETVEALARLKARLKVTIYAPTAD